MNGAVKKYLAFLSLLFLLVSCATQTPPRGAGALRFEDYGIPRELLSGLEIKPPAPDLPENLKRWSGMWCGKSWSGTGHCLVVTAIEADYAYVASIWGDDVQGRYAASVTYQSAAVLQDGRLRLEQPAWHRHYVFINLYEFGKDFDGVKLHQSWPKGYGSTDMVRMDLAQLREPGIPSFGEVMVAKYGINPEYVKGQEIRRPTRDVPEHLAMLSGAWCGKWNDGQAHCLIVNEIAADRAVTTRIWGKSLATAGGKEQHIADIVDGDAIALSYKRGLHDEIETTNRYNLAPGHTKEMIALQSWVKKVGTETQSGKNRIRLTRLTDVPPARKTVQITDWDSEKEWPQENASPGEKTLPQDQKLAKQEAAAKEPAPKPNASNSEDGQQEPKKAYPSLSLSASMTDGNADKVLDGGETVVLEVSVENKGTGPAKGVEIQLGGDPLLAGLLGTKRAIGGLAAGETREAKFEAVLPSQIPGVTAELRVSVTEGQGYSPQEVKVFRVAMKPAPQTEMVEVISEVNVDDVPARTPDALRENTYAVMIGISRYREKDIPRIEYAKRDAEIMARYLENIGGVPRRNIRVLADHEATRSDLQAQVEEWLSRRAKNDSTVFIYYAGHGLPDAAGQEAYIVPYEGHPDYQSKLYPLKRMYEFLGGLPAEHVIVMLDSCFSGVGGRSIMKQGVRPALVSIRNPVLEGGKVIVMAASSGGQASSDYAKAQHGLFTYYLLRGMRGEADANGDGVVELGELYEYVRTGVSEKASTELNRDQTPVLLPSADLAGERLKIRVTKTR